MRPQIKRAFPIYWLAQDVVRIGAQQGITKELSDPQGELRVLLPLLDGTRGVEEIVREMRHAVAHLSDDDVRQGIHYLDESGLIEDAAVYDDLPARLEANQTFFAAAAENSHAAGNSAQRVLGDAHVVLLGLGGGGSASLPQLLAAGLRKLTILDYDIVEESNLNRQTLFRTGDIGRKKTEVAEQYCRGFAPDCDVEVVDLKITSAEEIVQVARGADALICAIDEPRFIAQRRANSAAVQLGIPLVVMLTQHTSGRFFSVIPRRSGCLDCLHIFDELNTQGFLSQFRALMSPARDAATAAISPHIQRLTSFGVDEAIRLMTGYTEPLGVGKQIEVNYISGELRTIMEWQPEAGCPTCGSGDPRFDYIFEADPL
ncbi:ThiF family adenylyltransferase [Microbacterium sp. LWH11-1.2]|uniref:HesA/MoeB/ThiF family protein n=1 Tax=Microbacterium sp. LWH11-1.2 TaxID=3135258 RepID=UPI003138DEF2